MARVTRRRILKLSGANTGSDELIAYVPDRIFYRDPFSVGDVVLAGWDNDKEWMLA